MTASPARFGFALLVFASTLFAAGQSSSNSPGELRGGSTVSSQSPPAAPVAFETRSIPALTAITPAVQLLEDFKGSEVKFELSDLMDLLRDRRHEGWVLAAYPDPKTGRPLIGAGFSLDLPAREHPQRDHLNPHPFLEPSSAELWQAAGLDQEKLQRILEQYKDHLATWNKKRYRNKIRTLTPQIRDDEATLLLRIAAIQAIFNARAYCRNFDLLTSQQQMALSQLVYQMGVNLEEFSQFLTLINDGSGADPASNNVAATDREYWKTVQQSLIQSQWARLYRSRAISVIAMLDPQYVENPVRAEQSVGATLRPAVVHRRRARSAPANQLASNTRHRVRKTSRAHNKRKV
jgi:hypothetical protein